MLSCQANSIGTHHWPCRWYWGRSIIYWISYRKIRFKNLCQCTYLKSSSVKFLLSIFLSSWPNRSRNVTMICLYSRQSTLLSFAVNCYENGLIIEYSHCSSTCSPSVKIISNGCFSVIWTEVEKAVRPMGFPLQWARISLSAFDFSASRSRWLCSDQVFLLFLLSAWTQVATEGFVCICAMRF